MQKSTETLYFDSTKWYLQLSFRKENISTKLELISDSLGHSTNGTVHKYLSLDEERMRFCALSLEDTGISYKGGVFHV